MNSFLATVLLHGTIYLNDYVKKRKKNRVYQVLLELLIIKFMIYFLFFWRK